MNSLSLWLCMDFFFPLFELNVVLMGGCGSPHLLQHLFLENQFIFTYFFSRVTDAILFVLSDLSYHMVLVNYVIPQIFSTLTFLKSSGSPFSSCITCADAGPNGCLSNVFRKISSNRASTTAQTNPFQCYPGCWKAASLFPLCLT